MDAMAFSELPERSRFVFVDRELETQDAYIKVAEERRPYTPEAWTNARRGAGVYFYVAPTVKVYKTRG